MCCLVEKQVQEENEQLLACQEVCNDIKDVIHMYKSILEFNPDEQLPVEVDQVEMEKETQDSHIWAIITSKNNP